MRLLFINYCFFHHIYPKILIDAHPQGISGIMDVSEAIKKRWSVRSYKPTPVPEDDLMRILEAARLSPSARNRQHRKYVVVDPDEAFVEACNGQAWIGKAPVAIAGIVDPSVTKWAVADMSIAFDHMVLQATELGLGTCWIGAFNEQKVKDLLEVPENRDIVAILVVGYPDETESHKEKEALASMWARDSYAW
jgi:nitroreductase